MERRHVLSPRRVATLCAAILALVFGLVGLALGQQESGPLVLVGDIDGPIGPSTTRQIEELLGAGESRDASLVVLRIDTPGGLSSSTRDINKAILASPVPVAVYVAPSGARAASAGTYILYAAHIAAMTPGTNVGAATPVEMGGTPGLPGGEGAPEEGAPEEGEPGGGTPATNQGKLANKAVNDAVAQIRSLAELRGRNADWAEKAVREGASLSAAAALEQGVIGHVAADLDALLAALDGQTVTLDGQERTLATAGARVESVSPSVVTQVLGVLSNPNVALLLMTIGFYGLIFELANPGLGPGIPGAIALLLGLYSLNLLPIDYVGLALIGLGLALMAAEAVTPAFGVLGVGGAAAFAIGAMMLIDTEAPEYQISEGVVIGIALMSLLIVTLVVGAVFATRRQRAHAGMDAMMGTTGRVLDWSGEAGHVFAHGERWQARGVPDLAPGDTVEITRAEGLTLTVRRAESETTP
jgi:membrane-bound serine protease (ClpP class)